MGRTQTLIIGGGQAGLAISRCLEDRGIEHVVLERGRIAERWRSERWDSLRLLTPNWMARLPSYRYRGDDPDGYMKVAEVVRYLEGYARTLSTCVQERTTVTSVRRVQDGYAVSTDRGVWSVANVVIATGGCCTPFVPPLAAELGSHVGQLVPSRYRNADSVGSGAVLVVGASATGIQLADELRRAGRRVILSVGKHTRVPRRYRGRDVLFWLDRMGVLQEEASETFDLAASRRQPSLQLVGRPDHRTLDLSMLAASGVTLVGGTVGASHGRVYFADDLARTTRAADEKRERILRRVDAFIARHDLDAPPPQPRRGFCPEQTIGHLDLGEADDTTVLWATGFRRRYPWLHVPVLDARGELLHHGGVTPCPGLYALGLQFQRRRSSSFIDGVGADAEALAEHIAARAAHGSGRRASRGHRPSAA